MMTKKEAIAEHRKMWNWIADTIESLQKCINIAYYKYQYCRDHGFSNIENDCFLCHYTRRDCEICPLEWKLDDSTPCEGNVSDSNNFGLWWKCFKSKDWKEQAALARQIANLPERTDI